MDKENLCSVAWHTGKLAHFFNKYSLATFLSALKKPELPTGPLDIPANYPSGWAADSHSYIYNKTKKIAELSIREASNPKGVIFYSPGWKTHPLHKVNVVEEFHRAGYSVITMPLIEPENKTGTMAENITRLKTILFDQKSILHQRYNAENLPLFVVTHSTSGTVFEHAFKRARQAYPTLPDIAHVFHTAPFIDANGASRTQNRILSKIYRWHASKHKNEHAGTPLLDRLFYYAIGGGKALVTEDPRTRPTHGQILEISAFGNRLFQESDTAPPPFPVTVYTSTNDDFSSSATAKAYYRPRGASIQDVEAGHRPLMQDSVRREVIGTMDQKSIIVTKVTPAPQQEAQALQSVA